MTFKTEQEAFWACEFGTEYIKRNQAGASAVAAASMFHFTEQMPAGAKAALAAAGVPVRKPFHNLDAAR